MSNTSSAIYLTIMQSPLVESGLGLVWGFDFFFRTISRPSHPNLCPTVPKAHLKNPHILWLGPFCWRAVSQWLPFFMLVVHQIKTETTDEECELMGTEDKWWKMSDANTQLCLLNYPRAAGAVSGTTSKHSLGEATHLGFTASVSFTS